MSVLLCHSTTMLQSQLRENENRSRKMLASHRERAPVTSLSMIQYATQRHIDSGWTAPQTHHSHDVVSWGWSG